MSPWTFETTGPMCGSQGFIGHGYSEITLEYPPLPDGPSPTIIPTEEVVETLPFEGTIRGYVCTMEDGVYYCSNIEGPDGSQATWTQVNSGLGSYIYPFAFAVDPFDKWYRQYVLASAVDSWIFEGTLFIRENQGSWSSILTPGQAASVISGGTTVVTDFCVDEDNDQYLYALVYDQTYDDLCVIKSTNRGTSWSLVDKVGDGIYHPNGYWWIGNISALGDTIAISGLCDDPGQDNFYWITTDGGSTWYQSETTDEYGTISLQQYWNYAPYFYFTPQQPTILFSAGRPGWYLSLCKYVAPDSWDYVDDDGLMGTMSYRGSGTDWKGQIWGSRVNDGKYRVLRFPTFYDFVWTVDNWETFYIQDIELKSDQLWCNPDNEDDYIFAYRFASESSPHCIRVSTDHGETMTGRAGPSPGSAPYTDSIPYWAYVCPGGLQVWKVSE